MQLTTAGKSNAFATQPLTRKLFAVLAMGLLFTACKKDDDGPKNPPPPQQEQHYFASKINMQLKYRSSDADDPANYTLTVTGQKDSAGGKVFNYRSVYDNGSTITPFVYHKDNIFTIVNSLPQAMSDMVEEIESDPAVSDFTLSGLPLLQKLPANPQVNQAIEFSDPMHMGFNMEDEGVDNRVDMYFGFSQGKVVGFEDVTTEAGTFKNCMKVQFKATMTIETTQGNNEDETVITQWFAKGIGLVKSVDTGDTGSNTTMLVSVTGR